MEMLQQVLLDLFPLAQLEQQVHKEFKAFKVIMEIRAPLVR